MFVDYGNVVTILRREVWAPVTELQLFTLPPFGINCQMENISHVNLSQWQRALLKNSVQVTICGCSSDGRVYTVRLPDCMANSSVINFLQASEYESHLILAPIPTSTG